MEKWKDIEGYEGLYQISNLGRVKSLGNGKSNNSKEKILKCGKSKQGYIFVSLSKKGKKKNYLIHRLVAQAFIDNPDNLPEVNHINEDKTNNCVDNLEYCNRTYNINYGTRTEKTQKPILQFTKEGKFVKKWDGIREVERELGFSHSHISKCCKGKCKSVGGFKWCYYYKSIWEKNHIPIIKQKRRVA